MTACSPPSLEAPLEHPPSALARHELWQKYRAGADASVENDLVLQYLPLVRMTAARLAMNLPAHVSMEDLHSAGLVGLLQAVRHYDPGGGCFVRDLRPAARARQHAG